MHVVSLTAENFKKLKAVTIKPDGSMVEITGKNEQGKSSVLDALLVALDWGKNTMTVPIRDNEEEGKITVQVGDAGAADLTITRKFRRRKPKEGEVLKRGDDFTTSITVEAIARPGMKSARFNTPQEVIDGLYSKIAIDPSAFLKASSKQQYEQLKPFVVGFDFEETAKARKKAFDERTEINRNVESLKAQVAAVLVPDGTPEEMLDDLTIMNELEQIGDFNTVQSNRASARLALSNAIESATRLAEGQRAAMPIILSDCEADCQRIMDEAARQCVARRESAGKRHEAAKATAAANDADVARLTLQLGDAPLPEANKDPAEVRSRLDAAMITNNNVRKLKSRRELETRLKAMEALAAGKTKAIEDLDSAKAKAITEAKMPVDGITFGDGEVLLNNLPLEQASHAAQLRLACALAMATNPTLKMFLLRNGNDLDADALELVAKMAEEKGWQCWVERIESSGRVGFTLEDGMIKGKADAEA